MLESCIRIGVAGLMGSGKSTCSKIIVQYFPDETVLCINADHEAKNLMNSSESVRDALIERFGNNIITGDQISTKKLGEIAFKSKENLQALNSIVHPPLLNYLHHLIYTSNYSLCILDAALIPLWRIESWFTLNIWMQASFEERLQRLIFRDANGLQIREIENRMRLQEEILVRGHDSRWFELENNSISSLQNQLKLLLTEQRIL